MRLETETVSLKSRELRSPKVLISVPELGLQARIEVRKKRKRSAWRKKIVVSSLRDDRNALWVGNRARRLKSI